MLRSLQKSFVELPDLLVVLHLDLVVDVGPPDGFGHVHLVVVDGHFEDLLEALVLVELLLELSELDPGDGVFAEDLDELLVKGSDAVDVGELHLELDVLLEDLDVGALADGHAEDLAHLLDVVGADEELRVEGPELGEGEVAVRYQGDGPLVDLYIKVAAVTNLRRWLA